MLLDPAGVRGLRLLEDIFKQRLNAVNDVIPTVLLVSAALTLLKGNPLNPKPSTLNPKPSNETSGFGRLRVQGFL